MSNFIGVSQVTQQTTDKDELFICPFDPVHRISAKRFVYHYIKCRKNHPHVETATCPFNARHIVLKPDIRHHTSTCPDRKLVELELHNLDRSELSNDQLTVSNEALDFGEDEDWDEEIARSKACNEAPVFWDGFSSSRFSQPMTNGFSANAGGKKVNTRREAIKRMKERMRQEAESNTDLELRRPYLDQGNHPVFARSVTRPSTDHHAAGDRSEKFLSPKLTKQKPRLAANFSIQPKFPIAIGRGRHFQEMQNTAGSLKTSHLVNGFGTGSTKANSNSIGRGRQFTDVNHSVQSTSSAIGELSISSKPSDEKFKGVVESSSFAVEDTTWGNAQLQKEERKLLKLLKQIDTLEKKSDSGQVLNPEQKAKIARKEEIKTSLKDIRKQLMD